MSRDLWAKIAVSTMRDPKLITQPEWMRLFWINLILLAKEMGKDGALAGYTPGMLRAQCGLSADVKRVRRGLLYFQEQGMLTLDGDTIKLVNFIKRQGDFDLEEEREKWRERKRRQRDRSRGTVTGVPPLEETRREENRCPSPSALFEKQKADAIAAREIEATRKRVEEMAKAKGEAPPEYVKALAAKMGTT